MWVYPGIRPGRSAPQHMYTRTTQYTWLMKQTRHVLVFFLHFHVLLGFSAASFQQ